MQQYAGALAVLGVLTLSAVGLSAISGNGSLTVRGSQVASVGTFGDASLAITADNNPDTVTVDYNTDADIRWGAGNVQQGSCYVTGDGNDTGWRGEFNAGFPTDGVSTGPITSAHTWSLWCKSMSGQVVGPASVTVKPATSTPPPPPPPPTYSNASSLKPLPSEYVYNVLSRNPNAPYPGNRIEFFISPNGSDAPGVTGLTPDDAFKTGQHCIDYIYSTYYVGPSYAEVFCRYMGTGTAQPAIYYGNVQPTSNLVGAQGIAGTIVMFVGTMALDGPWDKKVGAYYGDARDVVIDSSKTPPYHCGTNFTSKPCTTFAGVNGTVFGILGLTIKSAPGLAAVSAASPGTVIAVGDVRLSGSPSVGLQAVSGGQLIVISDIGMESPVSTLVDAQGGSSVFWVAGTLHIKTFDITTLASIIKMSFADFSGFKVDGTGGQVATTCVINGNSVLSKSGATLPGPGSCTPSYGGQLMP